MSQLAEKFGTRAKLGIALGYRDGAFVGQMISGHRPISEKTVEAAHALPGYAGWFDEPRLSEPAAIDMGTHPELVPIQRGKLRLVGGMSGFAVDPDDEQGTPIFFRADWMRERGFKPAALLAHKVRGHSMEPSLFDGDLVVINIADTEPKDGEVFAVNYEGEAVIKRLVRDAGSWWLTSDNPDQRRYPRKEWLDKNSFLIGRIVHKQSERI